MRFLMKMILRSITVKPLRTAVIVLCLAAVSLTFSLCLTISISSKAAVEEQVRSGNGRADIVLNSNKGFTELPVLPDECESLPVLLAGSYFQIHDISNYKYVQKKNIKILGIDTAKAQRFGMLPECTAPKDGEAVISYSIALRYGYEVGDTFTLPCADNSEVTLTVSEVVLNKGLLSIMPQTMIVSEDTARTFIGDDDIKATMIYMDAPDCMTSEIAEQLSEMNPELIVQQLTGTAETEEMVSSLTRTFFMLFVMKLLMILFIITAFTKNIAAERLSVIGTLRSIGAEKKTAAFMLLTECAVYGLLGGVFGTVLFYSLKDILVGNYIPSVNGLGGSVSVPFYIPLTGVLLSAVISCTVSLATVIRTSKASIRDIIFGGKDSVYRPSDAVAVTGLILLLCALKIYVSQTGFPACIIGLAAFVIGLCLIIPKLLSVVSAITARHTDGGCLPVLRLALIQSGTKKTAVTGTIICTAVMLLTSSLYILSRSVDKLYSVRNYNCDVIITDLSERADRYSIITADRREFIYNTEETTQVNGEKVTVNIFGFDGFEMFSGLRDLPESLADDEIAFDKQMMKRLGIHEGDSVSVTLKSNALRPVSLTLTAVSGIDSIYFDQRCNAAFINLDTYKSVYHDYPSMLLAKGDTELMRRQLIDNSAVFHSAEEYYAAADENSSSVTGLLNSLAVMGVLLAVISVSGEQMIGFTQRRHELSVLHSQGMSIRQLSKMLFIETALTVFVPVLFIVTAGHVVIMFITKTLGSLDMNIPISYDINGLVGFIAVMSVSVVLTVLIPIRSIRIMNVAAALKQE
ncbi:ABC transporter permease [uncultured Ruminococcus sp.]|uniref:ABC transporter permease n=1 Tax=uncultured Ruminococcus sp. TaxID=165186 RepID=UPI0025E92DE4|nr:FtsX-like permease family protein [uncultured Ruminococcus sp.]